MIAPQARTRFAGLVRQLVAGLVTNDGLRNFAYDDENELIQVLVSNQWMSQFSYDGKMRRRIRQEFTWQSGAWVQTNEVYYVYDGNLVIQERDVNNLPTVTYTRGKDLSGGLEGAGGIGGLLARTSQASADVPLAGQSFYHCDGNGNVTMLISTNQQVLAKYLYDAFGNTISKSGLLADANVYRFSSKEAHPNSGLVYYLYRYYDPNLQRWPNRDPAVGWVSIRLTTTGGDVIGIPHWEMYEGVNPYSFVFNSPIASVDNNGLWTIGIGVQGGTSIWGAGGFSGGIYVGFGPGGWSFGLLGSGFLGSGGFSVINGSGFVQVTTAPCVSKLKGFGGAAGGSVGEGPTVGGGINFGNGYVGGELNIGGGIGTPISIQGGGTLTTGPTWGYGSK